MDDKYEEEDGVAGLIARGDRVRRFDRWSEGNKKKKKANSGRDIERERDVTAYGLEALKRGTRVGTLAHARSPSRLLGSEGERTRGYNCLRPSLPALCLLYRHGPMYPLSLSPSSYALLFSLLSLFYLPPFALNFSGT